MNAASALNPRKKGNVMIPDHVFGALVFVFVEIMFYSALLSSFFVMRRGRDSWGQNDAQALPVSSEGFSGLALALSVASILLALRSFSQYPSHARNHLFRAFGFGILFSGFQFFLGWKLYSAGISLTSSVFAGCLYLIFGSHLIQVIFGSLWMGKFLLGSGKQNSSGFGALRGLAVFWSFLFAIWFVNYVALFF